MSRTVRYPFAMATVFVLLAWSTLVAQAQAVVRFDIPVQPLADSLRAVGSQTHTNILFDPPLVAGRIAVALKADLTTDQALSRLLAGTGITHQFLNETTVVLGSAVDGAVPGANTSPSSGGQSSSASEDGGRKEGRNSSSDRFRVAEVDQGQTSSPSTVGRQDEGVPKGKFVQLEEVVVTGSRIPLSAGQQSVQPVRSYTHEDIANSGQSTMGEFLRTLPDVSTFASSSQQTVVGAQSVQLHGLPVGATLTLLDGRRVEAGHVGFFDLSTIPVSAVERVEILPVGASAIYGADALGGAVNFILRKDFNGFEVNGSLDHAVDVNDPSFNLAWGKAWGRGSVSLITSYENRGELLGTQRAPTSLSQFPGSVSASTVLLALGDDSCAPGTVYSLDGSNLPGLSSPQAGIPAGITGTPTIAQFSATAGKPNVCNAGQYVDITPQSQREGALFSAHYELAASADLFTQILFSHRHSQNQAGPLISVSQGSGEPLTVNNPYNPFGRDVNVSFVYPGIAQYDIQFNDLIRPMLGVRGPLFSDWHYEASGTFLRDRAHQVTPFADFGHVSAALASSDPATALNPFASGAPGTPQLLSSLANSVDTFDSAIDDQLVSAQVILRGPLAHLPAGAAQVVMGGDWSHEKQSTTDNSGFPPSHLQRKTYSMFGEARIPLLTTGDRSRAIERLTVSVAGRYDHSSDYGGKATWQGGLAWRATDSLSFSGSYGQSYQAPNLNQISGPQLSFASPLLVSDPFRGNELSTYPVLQTFGPNYSLKPETGSSSTFRLEYSSEAIQGLHASLVWYDLAISNYIGFQATQAVVANPMLFPGAVVRAPATPQDQQQGFLGVISQYNDTNYNFGNLRVRGFDADVSYAIDTRIGLFTPSLALSNIYKWTSALLPGTPAIDAVSNATYLGVGWAPRWKGTVTLAWKHGPLSMSVAGRYLTRYLDYQDYVPNANEIGDSWIVDMSARFDVGEGIAGIHPALAHAYIALGAVNLLNTTPPFSNTPYWYDIQQYDIRGRFLHLSIGTRL